jgi:molybdenum-dependent DNA-binding transcriptional regulator ModE
MAYNHKTDALQAMGKPYKAALIKIADMEHNTQRNVIEKLIAQAAQAKGFRVADLEHKKLED